MAISKAKKTEKMKALAGELEGSTTAIVGTFAKLTVAKDYELRKVIREAGGKYRVVKNKLAAISSKGTQVEEALKGLKGVNSVAFTSGDPVALAEVFAKWAGEKHHKVDRDDHRQNPTERHRGASDATWLGPLEHTVWWSDDAIGHVGL